MQKSKILIVEDDQDILDLLDNFLANEGFEVIKASSGEEGLSKFEEFNPKLIICDVMMPGMDGYEVLKEVKKRQRKKKQIPFIMLTAVDDIKKIEKAYQDEVDCYVTKPFDRWLLLKNIKTLLNIAKHHTGGDHEEDIEPPPWYR